MQVSPSLLAQVIGLANEDDELLLGLCELKHRPGVLCSLVKLDGQPESAAIGDLLPLNLHLAAVAFIKPEIGQRGREVAGSLQVGRVCQFDRKAEVFRDCEDGREWPACKDDAFLDTVMLGMATSLDRGQLRRLGVKRRGAGSRSAGLPARKLGDNLDLDMEGRADERRDGGR